MQKGLAEYRSMCGKTLAVVLASDIGALAQYRSSGPTTGNSVVCAVVDAACWAQTAFVYVLAVPQIGEDVTRNVHLVRRSKNAPLVQAVECDEAGMKTLLNGTGEDIVRELVNACPVDCHDVLVMGASHPLITAEQIYALCEARKAGTEAAVPGELPYIVECSD